jgi:hypothetical protein
MGKPDLAWDDKVDPKDLKGAEGFLTLLYNDKVAGEICSLFESGDVVSHRADDILRACRLEPLPSNDPAVLQAKVKLLAGKKGDVGPVLISRNEKNKLLLIQGYHRTSASYWIDPDVGVACVIVIGGADES